MWRQELPGRIEAELRGMVTKLAAAAREVGQLRTAFADSVPRAAIEFER